MVNWACLIVNLNKMRKNILIICVTTVILAVNSIAFADIIPEGQEYIDICNKVTNAEEFEDYYFIGVSTYDDYSVNIENVIQDECASGGSKFASYENFAVLKTDFPEADFSSIEGIDDERLITANTALDSSTILVKSPTNIVKVVKNLADVKSIDNVYEPSITSSSRYSRPSFKQQIEQLKPKYNKTIKYNFKDTIRMIKNRKTLKKYQE